MIFDRRGLNAVETISATSLIASGGISAFSKTYDFVTPINSVLYFDSLFLSIILITIGFLHLFSLNKSSQNRVSPVRLIMCWLSGVIWYKISAQIGFSDPGDFVVFFVSIGCFVSFLNNATRTRWNH